MTVYRSGVARSGIGEMVTGLAGLLADHAARTPHAPFLLWREEVLSYAEADRLIRGVAQRLRSEDAAHGATGRVAVFSVNSPAAIIVWLAAQAAGLTPVTLNREQRGELLGDVLRRSAPSVLVCDPAGENLLRETQLPGGSFR